MKKSSSLIWHYVVSIKSHVKILSIFLAFLENTNCNCKTKKKQNLTFISKSILVLHISSNSRNSFPIKCQTCHARLWKLLWGHQSRKLVVDLITLQHYEVLIILKLQACFFLYSIYRVIGLELMLFFWRSSQKPMIFWFLR